MMSTFNDLSPAVKYIMQVAALNDFGLSQYTAPVIGTTQPDGKLPNWNSISQYIYHLNKIFII